jgi:formate hydrogenlyase subunit 4
MTDFLKSCLAFASVLVLAPLLSGIVNKLKAYFTGRQGAPVLQPYYELFRVIKKETINSSHSSFISRISPPVNLACTVIASAMVPLASAKPLISFEGDIIFFAYVLGLSRFFQIIAAMDIGSSFEGMGASRESFFSIFAEPIFFFTAGALAFISGNTSLYKIFSSVNASGAVYFVFVIVSSISFFVLAVAECSRMPVDDPNTHLELTMIHEVMILDNSGADLFMYQYSAQIKLFIYMAFEAAFLLPLLKISGMGAVLIVVLTAVIFAFVLAVVETITGRIKIREVPQYLLFATAIGILNLLIFVLNK